MKFLPAAASFAALSLSAALVPVAPVTAESIAGVCPDGSAFIVQQKSQIPCPRARTSDPSELPPLKPHMLPRPYTWYVDQEERNPSNPYNVLGDAQKMRAARRGEIEAAKERVAPPETAATSTRPAPAPVPAPALADDQLRDLVRLVSLRQKISPAQMNVNDARGRESLRIQFAHSASLEHAFEAAGGRPDTNIVVFSAVAPRGHEFRPNFFVVQDGATHRPDPQDPRDVRFLVGEAGEIPSGAMALGYFTVPPRFDLSRPVSLFWNDRSIDNIVLSIR